jgi:hypothetical protein
LNLFSTRTFSVLSQQRQNSRSRRTFFSLSACSTSPVLVGITGARWRCAVTVIEIDTVPRAEGTRSRVPASPSPFGEQRRRYAGAPAAALLNRSRGWRMPHPLLFPLPRSSSCVPNMDKPRLPRFYAPINEIRITPRRKHARLLYPGAPPALGKFSDQLNGFANCSLDAPRAARTPLIDVPEDQLDVATRARRVANPHTPCLFQSASISSSLTNSPRRA